MEDKLKHIKDTYQKQSNKELVQISQRLYHDFVEIKNVLLSLTDIMNQIEEVYDLVNDELNNRTNYKSKND